jgi:hypothetical protein
MATIELKLHPYSRLLTQAERSPWLASGRHGWRAVAVAGGQSIWLASGQHHLLAVDLSWNIETVGRG